jgi:hypothetical protein
MLLKALLVTESVLKVIKADPRSNTTISAGPTLSLENCLEPQDI